ncbi:MAG: response regulator receiver [Nitrospirae bacterium]|nr:MAG: response regulator receiver [Nitrospirota bacterium]
MHEKILVIDDEPLVLLSIERALLKVGYEVVATSDMKNFLDAVASRKFDMIIMDLHMEGIRTNELAEEAKRHIPSVKFMTISGSVPAQDSRYFLQKPFKIDVLRERVREILDEPS